MALTLKYCGSLKNVLSVNKGILTLSRNYVLKYVDPTKYDISDVKVIKDSRDPKSLKILEKHGKAWHILNEGNRASLAQTVSGDFDMLSGLAREFAVHFKTNQQELHDERFPVGSCVPVKNGSHYIYYLVIRENWWDRGAYRPMRDSLMSMKSHALANNVTDIAMGRLGGQDDGLDFREISTDLNKIFYDTDITLTLYTRRT